MSVNAITPTGLTIESQQDIITDLSNGFISIYGTDINLESNTPDGQMINIMAAAMEDNLQLLESVYNSFSLTNAFGVQIDNLVILNGIQRQAGTYTNAYVTITVTQALTLTGMDALANNPTATVFSVSDSSGNQYQLVATYSFAGAGSTSLEFQSVNLGQILTTPNTITTILTPVIGVTSANNPTTASDVIGVNEESDIALKIRQAKSFQLAGIGAADSIRASLLNTPGIIDAFVPENDTGTVSSGVAANGIWVIVNAPTSLASTIANAIYSKKTAGTAMTGSQTYNITRPAGNIFTARWDFALSENLYISFTILPINGVDTFDTTSLATSLAASLVYKLGQAAFVGQVINAMLTIAPNGFITNVEVGTVTPPASQNAQTSDFQHYFLVAAANITISV